MDYLFQDGRKPKKTKSKTKTSTKSKTGSKTKSSSKTGTKSSTKTSSKKGGNFLGAVGDLVAPTGWGPFATAAGLLALDRADAALRRGKSEKSSAKKSGGGENEGITVDKYINSYKDYIEKYPSFPNNLQKASLLGEELKYLDEYYLSQLSNTNKLKKELEKLKKSVDFPKLSGIPDIKQLQIIGKYFRNDNTITKYSQGASYASAGRHFGF